jgi:hypothetical protein
VVSSNDDTFTVQVNDESPSTEYLLRRTCMACPEAYDVFLASDREVAVGWMRLRHGYFGVYWGTSAHDAITVHSATPSGDGIFANEEERTTHLHAGLLAMETHRLAIETGATSGQEEEDEGAPEEKQSDCDVEEDSRQ